MAHTQLFVRTRGKVAKRFAADDNQEVVTYSEVVTIPTQAGTQFRHGYMLFLCVEIYSLPGPVTSRELDRMAGRSAVASPRLLSAEKPPGLEDFTFQLADG